MIILFFFTLLYPFEREKKLFSSAHKLIGFLLALVATLMAFAFFCMRRRGPCCNCRIVCAVDVLVSEYLCSWIVFVSGVVLLVFVVLI